MISCEILWRLLHDSSDLLSMIFSTARLLKGAAAPDCGIDE